jgi:phosphoglycerate dehydrogenase-like enzyme
MTLRMAMHVDNSAQAIVARCAELQDASVVVENDPAAMQSHLAHSEILITQNSRYTAAIARACAASPTLRMIQSISSGAEAFTRHGVRPGLRLSTGGDIWAPTVAEHAMALLLALARQVPRLERQRQRATWDRPGLGADMISLTGNKLLVVGLGAIGRAVAGIAKAFGMRVSGIARRAREPAIHENVERISGIDTLRVELALADAIVLAIPLDRSTRHLIGRDELAALKPDALLVNVARGEIVDEAALVDALKAERPCRFATDVAAEEPLPASSPLWAFDNAIISPHVAGYDDGKVGIRLAELCFANIARWRAGAKLANEVPPTSPTFFVPAGA